MQALTEVPATGVTDPPDQHLWICPAQNERGEANVGVITSMFPLVQALGRNHVTVFGDSSMLHRTPVTGRVLSAEIAVERLLFPSHGLCYRPENGSPKRCCGFSFGFLHSLDCTKQGSGTWFTNKGVMVRNIWKLRFLKPSEIWQWVSTCTLTHLSSCLPLTWVWKNPKAASKTPKNHNMSPEIHMLNKFPCWLNNNTSHSTYPKGRWILPKLSMNYHSLSFAGSTETRWILLWAIFHSSAYQSCEHG